MDLAHLIAVARGGAPADLVLRNARVVDVLSADILAADIAVAGSAVAGVGRGYRGRESVDLKGRYVCPGFIDAHVHVESALACPREFARAAVPRGVTTVVTDPHEIANVAGVAGIRFMLRDAERAPLQVLVNVPSSVPPTRLATSGAALGPSDIGALFSDARVLGLAEVMDFPAVVSGDPRMLAAIAPRRLFALPLAARNDRNRPGPAPGMVRADAGTSGFGLRPATVADSLWAGNFRFCEVDWTLSRVSDFRQLVPFRPIQQTPHAIPVIGRLRKSAA